VIGNFTMEIRLIAPDEPRRLATGNAQSGYPASRHFEEKIGLYFPPKDPRPYQEMCHSVTRGHGATLSALYSGIKQRKGCGPLVSSLMQSRWLVGAAAVDCDESRLKSAPSQ